VTWPLQGQDPSPFLQVVEVIQKAMKLLHASQLHQVLYTSKPKCTLLAETCTLQSVTKLQGGGGEGKLYFHLFKLAKRQRDFSVQTASIKFVADCFTWHYAWVSRDYMQVHVYKGLC